jgi:tetratricopeptide (TPR) repeat protein
MSSIRSLWARLRGGMLVQKGPFEPLFVPRAFRDDMRIVVEELGTLGIGAAEGRFTAAIERLLAQVPAENAALRGLVHDLHGRGLMSMPRADAIRKSERACAAFAQAARCYETAGFPLRRSGALQRLADATLESPGLPVRLRILAAGKAYNDAIAALRPHSGPAEKRQYAAIMNRIGLMLCGPAWPPRFRSDALTSLMIAVREFARDRGSEEFAEVQMNVGRLHLRYQGDKGSSLGAAHEAFEQALSIYSRSGNRHRLAAAEYFLGMVAVAALQAGRVFALGPSLRLFENALATFREETMPQEFRAAMQGLGDLYFEAGSWPPAVRAYKRAIAAGEALHQSRTTPLVRATELGRNAVLYANAAYALAADGKAEEALLTLERGKTRELGQRLRSRAPLSTWTLDDVQRLLGGGTRALIALCMTTRGSTAFLLQHGRDVETVELPFRERELFELFEREAPQLSARRYDGWLHDYRSFVAAPSDDRLARWQSAVDDTLRFISGKTLAPLLPKIGREVKELIFLPSGVLFLLPLHAAPLPEGDFLGDRYTVSYSPSIEILLRGTSTGTSGSFYAAVNPEEDPSLALADYEADGVARFFTAYAIDRGRDATCAGIRRGMSAARYVHLVVHGRYDWLEPAESRLFAGDGALTMNDVAALDLRHVELVTLSACESGIVDVLQTSPQEYVGIPAAFIAAGARAVLSSLWSVPDAATTLLMIRFYENHMRGGLTVPASLAAAQRSLRMETAAGVADAFERQLERTSNREMAVRLFKYVRHFRHAAARPAAATPFSHPFFWGAFVVTV